MNQTSTESDDDKKAAPNSNNMVKIEKTPYTGQSLIAIIGEYCIHKKDGSFFDAKNKN